MTEATTDSMTYAEAVNGTRATPDAKTRMESPSKMLRSLNGYEEQAIEDTFGRDQEELGYGRQLRALVFTARVRAGAEPRSAYLEAMGMTTQEIFNEFDILADADADGSDDEDKAGEGGDDSGAEPEGKAIQNGPATSSEE